MDAGAIDDLEGKPLCRVTLCPHMSTNPELLAAYLEGDNTIVPPVQKKLCGYIPKTRATEELECKQKIDVFSIALLATIYLLTYLK